MRIPKRIPLIGVGCIVIRDDQLLMIRRRRHHGAGAWSTPGGHLDFGETPGECATRETLEETGIAVNSVRFLAITDDHFVDDARHYITLWMRADHAAGEAAVRDTREIADVGWFPTSALPDPLFLSLENLLAGNSLPPPPRSDHVMEWITRA